MMDTLHDKHVEEMHNHCCQRLTRTSSKEAQLSQKAESSMPIVRIACRSRSSRSATIEPICGRLRCQTEAKQYWTGIEGQRCKNAINLQSRIARRLLPAAKAVNSASPPRTCVQTHEAEIRFALTHPGAALLHVGQCADAPAAKVLREAARRHAAKGLH